MGQFKSPAREHVQAIHGPNCGCIVHRQERAMAAAKVQVATPEPALVKREVAASVPKLEAALASKLRKVAAGSSVTNPSSVINPPATRKRGRPIKSNDPEHQQARERARRYRDRKAAAQTSRAGS